MTADDLTAAVRACGPAPPGSTRSKLASPCSSNGTFLNRGDFTSRFIGHGTSNGTAMAAIDWDAAVTALANGGLPCSAGRGVSSCCPRASPTASRLISATLSPAWMTATPSG